jgi:competence protein ComEC
MRWLWDGVRVEVLHPERADYERAGKPNTLSCVLKLTAQSGATVLLTGDIEQAQELRLVSHDAAALKADVLLAPHHGSKTSSTAPFLQAVQAQALVVQVAYRSRYGHPHEDVLARYQQAGAQVLRTDCDGSLFWRSDVPQQWGQSRTERWRYWRHTCAQAVHATAAPDLEESD